MRKTVFGAASIALATLVGTQAFAAAHEMDASAMTCAEYTAMDSEAMMTATNAIDMEMMTQDMSEEEKTAAMAENEAAMSAEMTDEQRAEMTTKSEESMSAMTEACNQDGMAEMTVMEAMEANM